MSGNRNNSKKSNKKAIGYKGYKPTKQTETELKKLIRSANMRTARSNAPGEYKLPKLNYNEIISSIGSTKEMQKMRSLLKRYTDKNALTVDPKTGLAKWQKQSLTQLKREQTRDTKKRQEKAEKESVFVPGMGNVAYLGKSTKKNVPKYNYEKVKKDAATEKILKSLDRQRKRYADIKNESFKENFIKAVKMNLPGIGDRLADLLEDIPGTYFFENIYKPHATELDFDFIYSEADANKKANEVLAIIGKEIEGYNRSK